METMNKNEIKINKIDEFMHKILLPTDSSTKKQVYLEYEEYIDQIKPIDLFYLNMYKQSTIKTIEEIKDSADKFVNVFHQRLEQYEIKAKPLYLNIASTKMVVISVS